MIDCRECRKLIDSDLEDPLGPQDRASVSNHLRECHACVTYRKERLRDSSILRRSVDSLTEQVEKREAAAPPPAPRRPSLWPWFATSVVLIAAAVGCIIYFKMPNATDDPPSPPVKVARPGNQGRSPGRTTPQPGGPERPVKAPTPTRGQPEQPRVHVRGRVDGPDGRPAGGARVVLVRSAHPSADCLTTRSAADGTFSFQVAGRLPVHLTAWTTEAVSQPLSVGNAGPVRIELRPGRRIEGQFTLKGNLDPATLRVVAQWGRHGRSISEPAKDGRFHLTLPADSAVELRPYRDGLRTFSFEPSIPVTIPAGYAGPVRLRAVPGRILLVSVFVGGRPLPANVPVDFIAALGVSGNAAPYPLTPAPDRAGAYHVTVPPGAYRLVVRVGGHLEAIHQVAVGDFALLKVPLVKSPATFSGRFRRVGDAGDLPSMINLQRHPPLFLGDPGLRVPVDTEGRFTASEIPWAQVKVLTESEIPRHYGPFMSGSEADLPVAPGARIQGVVRDAAGKPLAGARLTAETRTGKATRQCDKDGKFTFTGLPAGVIYLYPQCELTRIEALPALREQFRIDVPPNATVPKDVVLTGAMPSDIRVRDGKGRPVVGMVLLKTRSGARVQVAAALPLDPKRPEVAAAVQMPPVRPGVYQVEVAESGVYYPLGPRRLPGKLELVVQRTRPPVILTFTDSPDAPRSREPLRIELRKGDGRLVSSYALPRSRELEIGGLAADDYEVVATRGAARARGFLRLGAGGDSALRLALVLR